ncbi:hypothetical protein [Pedobacter ginsengisoli]|uniref:hypothetical protein n=1 Tax=Pedobacter ginsengisoli TaxID=363852 RepID=UPI00254BED2B|nr:hypothetical protein [Pedobacter ginsengisoli]
MQDKEFDQLFKDRFEEAEVQPSANLWGNIAEQLEPKRKHAALVYWWSVAAVILMTVGIGLLTPKTEKIRLQSKGEIAAAEVVLKDTVPVSADQILISSVAAADQDTANISTPLVIAPRYDAAEEKNNLFAVQPNTVDSRPDIKKPEVPAAENAEPENKTVAVNEVMIASADLSDNDPEALTASSSQEHRGIRNVGDLVNFVVNKVDKRENKIVQFDTDDDNSSLVSLNLGIIRFSKRSNK